MSRELPEKSRNKEAATHHTALMPRSGIVWAEARARPERRCPVRLLLRLATAYDVVIYYWVATSRERTRARQRHERIVAHARSLLGAVASRDWRLARREMHWLQKHLPGKILSTIQAEPGPSVDRISNDVLVLETPLGLMRYNTRTG